MRKLSYFVSDVHLGLHLPVMLGRGKAGAGPALTVPGAILAGVGFWLFWKNGMPDYLFFRVPFAFLDYDKAGWLVFLENALMLSAWAFLGAQLARLCLKKKRR